MSFFLPKKYLTFGLTAMKGDAGLPVSYVLWTYGPLSVWRVRIFNDEQDKWTTTWFMSLFGLPGIGVAVRPNQIRREELNRP